MRRSIYTIELLFCYKYVRQCSLLQWPVACDYALQMAIVSTHPKSVLAGRVSICGLLFVALLCVRRACHCQTGVTIETQVQT